MFIKYFLIVLLLKFSAFSQTPVQWTYTTKKISDKTYEVHIKASVQSPWHIYSQSTPDGGPLATKISFNKNPLIITQGKPKEVGKMVQKYEDVFGVDVKYFDGDVEFVQEVTLRGQGDKKSIKTNVKGTIEFMACNDEQCLPPKMSTFSVKLE
jgi:hypothetical protein